MHSTYVRNNKMNNKKKTFLANHELEKGELF